MVLSEDSDLILPGWSEEQVLLGLQDIYTPEQERLGVLVLELEEMSGHLADR